MATSLSIAKRNPSSRLIPYGEEAKRFLRSLGITRRVTDSRIWIDPSGLVSWDGKIVRRKDGTLVPPPEAEITRQGKATAQLQKSARNQALLKVSKTVQTRQELEERNRQIQEAKKLAPTPPPSRPATPKPAPSVKVAVAKPVLHRAEPAAVPAPKRPTPPNPPGSVPRGLRTDSASSPSNEHGSFVPLRAVATVINGVTVLFLKSS